MDLTYNSPIRAAAWGDVFFARVTTVQGYAEKYGDDVQEALDRAKRLKHPLASTCYVGPALLGDRGAAERQNAQALAQVAKALTVKTGDRVTIDGVPYLVRFAPGNEKGFSPRNSDPIHFIPVAE